MSLQKIEDVQSYVSKPFDILCERTGVQQFKMTVINNSTKESEEIVDCLSTSELSTTRDSLIMKWFVNLGS